MDRLSLTVRQLVPEDYGRWDAFVAQCPQATFFHQSAWADILADTFNHRPHFLFAEQAGEVVAILPMAEVRSMVFGHALTSLPFCVYGGPVGDVGAVSVLEAEADRLARELGVTHLEYRNVDMRHEDWPRQTLYVTFRKDILPDVDANMQAIPRKQRAMVRKGIKHGLSSRIDSDVDTFFDLYSDNVLRHGTPALPKHYFERLKQRFGDKCEVLTVVDAQGVAVSSVMSFYFRDEVLPYYAGDAPAARAAAGNDFKYWELMRRACEQGCKVFDYGRSKVDTGSFAFKKNWGFKPCPLNYEYRLYKRDSVPQNNPANPKYRAFIALWRRLPKPLANTLGPHIVRSLG